MKFLAFFLCVLWGLPAVAQRNIAGDLYDYSTLEAQRIDYRLSYSNIYVKFQPNTTDAEIGNILRAAGFKVQDGEFTTNVDRNPRGFSKVSLSVNSTVIDAATLKTVLTTLEANAKVIVANPYIVWKGAKTDEGQLGITEEFYVKLKPTTTVEELKALVAVTNTSIKAQYPYDAYTYILIADKNARGNSLEMANQFYQSSKFQYAAVDFEIKPTFGDYKATPFPETKKEPKGIKDIKDIAGVQATVNDPLWPWQYSHRITGAIPNGAYPVNEARAAFPGNPAPRPSDQPWNLDASMLVDRAWDVANTAGAGIKVAVIDEGVDRGHPDLIANMNPLGFDPSSPTNLGDANGSGQGNHGTTCAGVIAATANNNLGVAGVAYNSSIVSVQIFNTNNAGVAQGIDWARVVANVDVMSNSWGFSGQAPGFTVPVIQDAFTRALTLGRGGKGCVILASTGNGGGNYASFPGSIPGLIGVIASNAGASRAGFSQFGQFSDLAAPGNQIMTTDRRDTGAGVNQGYTSGDYCIIDGTSFSCPNAAAVAALILGVDNTLTQLQVRQYLEGTCKQVPAGAPYVCNADQPNGGWGSQLGYGIINAYEAVLQAKKADNFCNTVTFTSANGTFEDGSFARNYEKGKTCTYAITPTAAGSTTVTFQQFDFAVGDRLEIYNNTAGTGTPIATLTSANRPSPTGVRSTTGVIFMKMITAPNSPTAQGFKLCYTADVPAGDFTVNPAATCVGVPVVFTPVPAAGSTITEYRWNFGAGAVPATATTLTATPVTVTYTTTGLKTINLTLVGPGGSVDVLKTNFVNVPLAQTTPVMQTLETGLPSGWSIQAGGATTWQVLGYTNPALRLGGFAESVRAAFINFWNIPAGQRDVILTTPMDLRGMATPFLVFDVAHQPFVSLGASQDVLGAQVSLDCGATWTTIYAKQSEDANPNGSLGTVAGAGSEFFVTTADQWRREVVPFPAAAANQNNVLVRFIAVSDFGNNLFLDNINVTSTPPPGAVNRSTPTAIVATTASFSAVATSGTQISLSWSDNSSNETAFLLQRAISGTAAYTTVASLPPNTTSYVDAGLANSTTYTYRLFAINGAEVSSGAVGAVASVTTQSATENFTTIARATTQAGSPTFLLQEDFSSCGGATLPAGWSNVINAGDPTFDFWRVNTDGLGTALRVAQAPFVGCFAKFDSDRFSSAGGAENVELVSPIINATGLSNIFLNFDVAYRAAGGSFSVDVFNPTTMVWVNVLNTTTSIGTFPTGTFTPISQPTINISSIVANTTGGRVRFRFIGNFGWYAAIDNVAILSTVPAPSNLTASVTAPTQVTLNWIDNTASETGFDIERSTTSNVAGFATIGTSAALAATGATGTYLDNAITPGTTYWYRVRARLTPTSVTDPTNVVMVQTVAAPTALVVTNSATSVNTLSLTWTDNATNETGYVVERSLSPGIGYAVVGQLGANATSYNDFGLNENTRYFYRVAAAIGTNLSNYSNEANGTTRITLPTNLVATPIAQTAIRINWTDNSNNESGYRIESSSVGNGTGFALLANVAANTTEYTHGGLTPDTRVFYRISPVGINGNLATYTNEATAVTFPSTPTNLVATGISSSAISLTWTDISTTELGYEIYRSTSLSGTYDLIDRLPRATFPNNDYIDPTVRVNVMYFYRVRAYRNAGEFSTFSNTANATPVFPAPTLSITAVGQDRISLAWIDNATDDDGFVVERTTQTDASSGVAVPVGFTAIKTVAKNVLVYVDQPLQIATTYYYRVRAIKNNPVLTSLPSNIVSATTNTGYPNAPINLRGTPGNAVADLSWNTSADVSITAYEIYGFDGYTPNKLYATTVGPVNNAKITGLVNGRTYYFRVKAVNKVGFKSDYSNQIELTPSIALGNEDDLASSSIKIYPNPTAGDLNIEIQASLKPTAIVVVSVTGQTVYSEKVNNYTATAISLGNVAAGMYIVRVETENGSYQRKIQVIK
jgi:subtilisin family serine protease